MREATPLRPRVLDLARAEILEVPPSDPGSVLAQPKKVARTTVVPWVQVCKIFLHYDKPPGHQASGVVVGRDLVLTVGHALFSEENGPALSIEVVPAFEDGAVPYGTFFAEDKFAPDRWKNEFADPFDLGLIKVGRCGDGEYEGGHIGDIVGWRGIAFNLGAKDATGVGYPLHPGGALEMYSEQLSPRPLVQLPGWGTMDGAPSAFKSQDGASGGPWLTDPQGGVTLIRGIYSSRIDNPNSRFDGFAFGPHFGPELRDFLKRFVNVVESPDTGGLDEATLSADPAGGGKKP